MQERWELIRTLVKNKRPNVLQLGANKGEEVRAFKRLWPWAEIYCFEPRAAAIKELTKAYGDNPRIHLIQQAVSKTQGLMDFHITVRRGGSSLLERNPESKHYSILKRMVKTIKVPTVTLDGFCEEQGIRSVGLLFMDIQGGELAALQGATALLERQAIEAIYAEVFFIDLYKDCPQFEDVNRYLESFGYRFVKFFNFGRAKGKPPTMWSDALFVKGD